MIYRRRIWTPANAFLISFGEAHSYSGTIGLELGREIIYEVEFCAVPVIGHVPARAISSRIAAPEDNSIKTLMRPVLSAAQQE